jgi:hypothetical protein
MHINDNFNGLQQHEVLTLGGCHVRTPKYVAQPISALSFTSGWVCGDTPIHEQQTNWSMQRYNIDNKTILGR